MGAEISAMRLDIVEIKKALKDETNTLQKKVTEDIVILMNEMNAKLDNKVGRFELDGLNEKIATTESLSEQSAIRIATNYRSLEQIEKRIGTDMGGLAKAV